jgi:predicted dehydrogenase
MEEARPLASQCKAKVYSDFSSMLPDVDVVDICTPTDLHYGMVLQAAAAGKDIVCEKPLARTLEQGREMVEVCHKHHVKLLVAHVVRFFSQYAMAKATVDEGKIGTPGVIRLVRGSFRPKKAVGNWFLDESKSGGILLDLMIHDYDYARWIAGEVESVYAKKVTTGHPDASIDYGLVILKHRNGALSHITGAWAYPPPTFRTSIEISGDKGLITFDSDETTPIQHLIMQSGSGDSPDVALPSSPLRESPYTTQIKEFYKALTEGSPTRIQAEDGLAALQIALAAIHSAETGRAIYLDPLQEMQS